MSAAIKPRPSKIDGSRRWSDQSDEQLLLAYRNGKGARPFEELVHRYERELFQYLQRYLADAALAEDAFQATFLQVHLKQEQFEEGRRFRPWLYTIATHQAIDAQRRNKRHRIASLDHSPGSRNSSGDTGSLIELLLSHEPAAVTNVEEEERRTWIRGAVDQLPEQYRRTVILIYYQGLKYRETAEALGIPVGTVKSRMHAAIEKLLEAWDQTHSPDND